MEKNISVIIPAQDEERSIKTLYSQLTTTLRKITPSYEIIFIDDGSVDNTCEEIKKLVAKDKKVKVIKHRGNFGKAVALQNGFRNARGKIIFTMDADLQDDPQEIPKFLEKLNQGYDMVSGWKQKRHDPLLKVIPSRIINLFVRVMTGLKTHDINCGFKAYKKEVLTDLNLYGDLYRFIPIFVHRQNFKVGEITVAHRERRSGKSKYGWKRLISGWLDLLTVFFLVRYLKRPGHFFGTLGVISFFFGFCIGLYITYLRITTGSIQYRHPLLFLGMLLMIIGVQLISTGLLAEMIIFQKPKQNYESYIQEKEGV